MKSSEVYSILRDELGPWAKAQGFKRERSMLSWSRPSGDEFVTFWFQVSQGGWDPYSGSQFTMEFQRGSDSRVGTGGKRERLSRMLDDANRERMRQIQNRVIAALPRPPRNRMALAGAEVNAWYLRQFDQVARPYSAQDDVWMRYGNPSDVEEWARFICPLVPACLSQVDAW